MSRQPVRGHRAPGAARRARPRDGRAERDEAIADRDLEPAPQARRSGVRDEHDRGAEGLRAERALAEPAREPAGDRVEERLARRAVAGRRRDQRGDAAPRQCPARGGGGRADRLLGRRRVLAEQADEAPPAALALAGGRRLLLCVALRRLGRELVDVGEDRLAERVDDRRRQPGLDAGLDEPPPREPRSHPVGGQQGVEAAPGVELAAAEVDVGRARLVRVRRRIGQQVDEAVERHLHAEPDDLAELAFERTRVARHLAGDRGDRLVGEARQDGAQRFRRLGRDGA